MAISLTRYVDIVSSVGAGTTVARRSFIGRIFDTNHLIPSNSFLTFTTAADVLTYFGAGEEYNRALQYFSWISKNGTKAQSLDFARWVNAPQAPEIFGNKQVQTLAVYTAITSGTFGLTIAGTSHTFSIDFSTATSLGGVAPSVASLLQAAIQAADVDPVWASATVTYDAVRSSFQLVGGATGPATITVQAGVGGTPIAGPGSDNILGWFEGTTLVVSDGAAAQTPVEAVMASVVASNNFGSFLFMNTTTLSEVTAVAAWNATQNVTFMYLVAVASQTDATNYNAALIGYQGTGVELSIAPGANNYVEQDPMQILAATNYDAANSVQNYMFQVFPGQTPSVTDDATANFYDALRVNYYGQTQTAGQFISFFQRGNLMGGPSAPIAMNVYANEMWLKDAMGAALMQLLLVQGRVPANAAGKSLVLSSLQSVIDEALNNGTISANKLLTNSQIAFITSTAGDDKAWYQVQNSGYWVNCEIVSFFSLITSLTEFKAVYTLIYSKDDTINLITGQQILI